jgi:hypothetical protein
MTGGWTKVAPNPLPLLLRVKNQILLWSIMRAL